MGVDSIMPKKKRGVLVVVNRWGNPTSCTKCGISEVTRVVHEDIDWISLKDYIEELDSDQRSALRKRHPKQCDEKFLCEACFQKDYYNNDERYDPYTHQADFTTVYIRDWKNKEYLTIDEVVNKMMR
jgi:hypothetical protein